MKDRLSRPQKDPRELGSDGSDAALRLQIVTECRELGALRDAWSLLLDGIGRNEDSIFQTPSWILPWWRTYGRGSSLVCLAVWHFENLVGLAPLMVTVHRGLRVLRFAGFRHADYTGPLILPGHEGGVTELFLQVLDQQRIAWDLFLWDRALPGPIDSLLPSTFNSVKGLTYLKLPPDVLPLLELPNNWITYESTLTPGRRYEFRLKQKRFWSLPGARFDVVDSPEEVHQLIENLRALLLESWHRRGREGELDPGMKGHEYWSFLTTACRDLAENRRLRIGVLRAEGRTIATGLYFASGGRILKYIQGWAPPENVSPGLVLDLSMIRWGIEKGYYLFDMGLGDESYKYRYGARREELQNHAFAPNSLLGWAALRSIQARRYLQRRQLFPLSTL